MSIRATFKSATYGQKLIELEARGQRAIDELESLRTELPHMKTQIDADPDYTPEQKAAAKAEVDAVISGARDRDQGVRGGPLGSR